MPMIRKRSIRPALLLLVGLSAAGIPPVPEPAGGSCRTIAAILSVYPTLTVRISVGTIRDPRNGTDRSGCRVDAAGPAAGMVGEVPPEEPIRFLLWESGWEEDPRYASRSPGTVAFALRKNGVLCLFSGDVPPGAGNGGNGTARWFEFHAGCAATPE